ATKLYCFVHKTPVCFDCICAPDHQHCVVWQYSDWVNDGDYDWPPHCAVCSESLEDTDKPTIRLSCLHVPHAECVKRHVESFPPNTAPAGFTCASPGCGLEIWPARSHKDSASALYTHLRALLAQTSVADVILSTPVTSDPAAASAQATALSDKTVPPAFGSGPLAVYVGFPVRVPVVGCGLHGCTSATTTCLTLSPSASVSSLSEGDQCSLLSQHLPVVPRNPQPQQQGGVNIARSRTGGSDRTAVDITEEIETAYRTDEEAGERKYARRGPAHLQFLRVLGSWWSPALHALPVTLTATHSHRRDKDEHAPVGAHEDGRRRAGQRRSGGVDPRKLLLIVAIV
ncbi:unnamed protein product, partial [Closterium sp. NIES-64]